MATQAPDAGQPAPRRADVVARWLAAGAATGGALLIASYFMPWITPAGAVGGYSPPPMVPIAQINRLQGSYFQTVALWLLTPPLILTLFAPLALVGPRWSRITLSLLSALAGAYLLLSSLGFVSSRLSRPGGTYAIDAGAYIGVGASLLGLCAASGLFFTVLGGAWRTLLADAPRAHAVTRRWAWLVAGGSALLVASYFMPWRHFYLPAGLTDTDPAASNSAPWPLNPAPESPHIPVDISQLSGIAEPFRARNIIMIGLIFFAPPLIAGLGALFALIGPRWSRSALSLLSALAGGIILLVSGGYLLLSAFSDSGASSVIDLGAYIGISASLLICVAAVGLVFATLNGVWSAPVAGSRRAGRVMGRLWATLVVVGSALLVASYFALWGHWLTPGISEVLSGPNDHHQLIPITLLFDAQAGAPFLAFPLLLAPPGIAATCAFLALGAPRQRRLSLSQLCLLGGGVSLAVALYLAWSVLSRSSGMGTFDSGALIGVGAAALTLLAAFGLLSTPPETASQPPENGQMIAVQ